MTDQLDTPIILMVFNRPERTRMVFSAIAEVKPKQLLIVADGPRSSHPGEEGLCDEVRAIVNNVDWPCEVFRDFAESNLGCQARVVSGLTWAFSKVEEAIILEDDCVPHQTFFPFCRELLGRYRGDSRIGMICGSNFLAPRHGTSYSYHFSKTAHVWGWATWRSAWQRYDRDLRDWEAVKRNGVLSEIYSGDGEVKFWTKIFDSMHDRTGINTWDFQWLYTSLINNMLCVVPSVNMVRNIGFGPDATHTRENYWSERKERAIEFPLRHPPYIVPMKSLDALHQQIYFMPTIAQRVQRKIRSYQRLRQRGEW